VVYPKVIAQHVKNELPFMATENIMMRAVKRGGDRQVLHEQIRQHAMAAGRRVKEEGLDNDLVSRIAADAMFGLTEQEIIAALDPAQYIGRCPSQVDEFIQECVRPAISPYLDGKITAEVNV